jgi:hypothetical protein
MSGQLPEQEPHRVPGNDPAGQAIENVVLKLKMMAELGADVSSAADLPPDLEQQFLQQVYAFERNYASGEASSFADTLGVPDLPNWDFIGTNTDLSQEMLKKALAFYRQKNIEILFHFDYPLETRYRFLVEDLPGRPNHFGGEPKIMVGLSYEDYHPNHNAELEEGTRTFMEAIKNLEAEDLQGCMSPVQFLPEGPYPTQVLLDALKERFQKVERLDAFEYVVLETSYDLEYDDAGETEMGLGYAEGLVRFDVVNKSGEVKSFGGPYKLYFHFELGVWSIMYMHFPGIKYPPKPDGDMPVAEA